MSGENKSLLEEKSKANISKSIMATKIWTNSKERKDFNQEWNKIDVLLLQTERKAKGDIKTNILINTYLTA